MSAGRACVSTPFVLPPPRWERAGVGVMRAECIDPVEHALSRGAAVAVKLAGGYGGSGDAL